MAPGGQGPASLAIMWSLTAVTLVFVSLRLYTRYFIIQSLGADDVAYVIAGLFLLLYNTFLQVAVQYGFGQPIAELELHDIALAIKWEMVGQTFAVVGMSISKISLGLFLLRFVVERWHRVFIWVVMLSLFGCSALTTVVFWLQCVPVQGIYDPAVKPRAKCNIKITPFAIMLGVWCIVSDFFFATFPAMIIWGLNMKKKEKIIIISSMSLGVLAGVAGIIRTYEVAVGFTADYTKGTVRLIVWSAVEMAVTMVCIGIPILRPLYRRIAHGYAQHSGDNSYQKQGEGNDSGGYEMRGEPGDSGGGRNNDLKLGLHCQTITEVQASQINNSDESISSPRTMDDCRTETTGPPHGINIKDDVRVEWNRR